MKRNALLKALRKINTEKGAEFGIEEMTKHTRITFDGQWVTTVARHSDVNEITAKSSIEDAEQWAK